MFIDTQHLRKIGQSGNYSQFIASWRDEEHEIIDKTLDAECGDIGS